MAENPLDAGKEFQSAKSELDTSVGSATDEYLGSVNPLMKDISGIRQKEAETKMPTVEIPEAPKLEMGNWAKASIPFFAIAAVAGSLAMRTEATGAIEALNGALLGLHTGSMANHEAKMQQYEKHVEALLAAHKQQMDEYNKILFNDNLTIQEKQDQINLQSNIYGNKMGLAKTTFQEQVRMITQFGKMGTQLKIAHDKVPPTAAIVQERASVKAQLKKDHKNDPTYEPTEPEIDAAIKASKAGGKSGGRMFTAPTEKISLPKDIKTTSAAKAWLMKEKKMTEQQAIDWIKANG
jgi:hypothetical protein